MDDIKKLRNLLQQIAPKEDFSLYDKNINKFYQKEVTDLVSEFNVDEKYFKIKKDLKEYDRNEYLQYIFSLRKLKSKCESIVKNNISLSNFVIPSKYYSGSVLLLDDINNVEEILELLNKHGDKKEMFYKSDTKSDFNILKRFFKFKLNRKEINVKRKYRKMDKQEIAKDIACLYKDIYIDLDDLNFMFALFEKNKAKSNVNFKIIKTILRGIVYDYLPIVVVSSIVGYICLGVVMHEGFSLIGDNSSGYDQGTMTGIVDFSSIWSVAIIGTIVVVVVLLERSLGRNYLYKLPIVRGVNGHFALMIGYACHFFVLFRFGGVKSLLLSALVTLSAIFLGFLAGPCCRKMSDNEIKKFNFSLIGRYIIGITIMDVFFIFSIMGEIVAIVLTVLILFISLLGITQKSVDKSPWYGR